jgi:hypothetical protein
VTDAWQSAKIKQFEYVLVGSAGALLRISGTAPRRKSSAEPRPTLVADDGHVVHRFAPIPSPADKRGVLRAAYSVSAEVLKPETVFSLELPDGYVISLPAPTSGAPRLTPGHDNAVEPAADPGPSETSPPEVEDDRRSDVTDKLAELSMALAAAERAGAEHQAARAAAEADADAARDEARELGERLAVLESTSTEAEQRLITNLAETETENEQWAARFTELETWRGELERRLTETVTELDASRTRLREDERELLDLREQLADAQATAELARSELSGLQGRLADVGTMDADARDRIRQLESERQDQAHHAAQLAELLQSAEQLAERLCAAAGPVPEIELEADPEAEEEAEEEAEAEAEGALETDPEADIELDAIARRAETDAAERAATELAAAAAEARLRR